MKKTEETIDFAGKRLTLSTGHVAQQASGAVMATYGETVVLATVVASDLKEDRGYFPLTVEYQERLYAGGRIKGSRWVKREGRPSDDEILTARLIDRSIRPLFPEGYKKDVQVMVTVLSVDLENSPDIPSAVAVSAALAVSSIPWEGPIGTVKVGLKDKKIITNPLEEEMEKSQMELVVSTTDESVVMIESRCNQVPESQVLEGVEHAFKESKKLIKFINDFAGKAGVKKESFEKEKEDKNLAKKVKDLSGDKVEELIKGMAVKDVGYDEYDAAKRALLDSFEDEDKSGASKAFDTLFKGSLRKMLMSGKRPDGRKPDEVRELSSQVSVLPRTHGSAIFQRGKTQALTIATLGAQSLEQLIETPEGEESKRYIHHYSMPPYSVGETGRVGSPKRREIGHGALAEKALFPVIPGEDKFPYTIRLVTEILSSNGSTSMAATCGSTLSLMDAGVPIDNPVAGIAMGLVLESPKKYKVLTDIVGIEDGNGDMDLKVAGTKKGVTAIQLDVKTKKLTLAILKEAVSGAKKARDKVLAVMLDAIKEPKSKVSELAPKIKVVSIDKEKIGELIGPGGKVIREIIKETGAQVDVDDDGKVSISSESEEGVAAAVERVKALTKDVQVGEVYDGEVKRIQPFGAFVEILPGKEGMVHVSDISEDFVKDPSDELDIGQAVKVKVKKIDDFGRINLTMLLDEKGKSRKPKQRKSKDYSRGKSRYKGNRGRGHPKKGKSKGPHFPTSRYLDDKK
ncbi:MAG: polyribonucleotide nucleotidyltransferase [Candidatus Woesebacteria bacterium]|jgi:polyribonucleotide nucleotidyltransferase